MPARSASRAAIKDGRITARECEVWWNGGAYADIGPRITQKSGFTAPGPYDIENVQHRFLFALHQPAAGRRAARLRHSAAGVGLREPHRHDGARAQARSDRVPPQQHSARGPAAGDRHADAGCRHRSGARSPRRAHELGQAPFERGNGTVKRGRGIAIGFKASISPTTSIAIVNVAADGSVTLYCSTVDMGQGSDTANAQLVAEVLNIPAESVRVVHPDTDVTPYDMATLGSRSHVPHGQRGAGSRPRMRATRSPRSPRELGLPEGSNVPVAELFQKKYKMQAGNIIGTGSYIPSYVPPDHERARRRTRRRSGWSAPPACEIEVDTETGHVRVTKLVNVADVGRADQSAHRRDAAFRRGHDAVRLHHAGEDGVRRRPGHQRLVRRLQDSRASSTFRRHASTRRSKPSSSPARSAPRASARAARSGCRRRSPTRSRMRSACG